MIDFKQINIIQKFCDNRVNYDLFIRFTNLEPDYYAVELFKDFRINPIRFMTSTNNSDLFYKIINLVDKKNYKG